MNKKCGMLIAMTLNACIFFAMAAEQQTWSPDELEKKERLRHTVLLPFKFITDYGAENGELSMLQIRPLYTISSKHWNFINRPVIPIIDIDGVVGGRPELPNPSEAADARGLGDITYTVVMEARELKPVSVAAGIATSLPTASEDGLGSGKWSAGPAVMVMTRQEAWSALIQARQIWSFAGDSQRTDVNNLAIEPIITYNFTKQWYLVTDPVILANWELDSGDRWLVPLGGGSGYRFKAWSQLIDLRLEAYYNVVNSKGAPDWSMAATIAFIFQ
jgi:hypothetical protein